MHRTTRRLQLTEIGAAYAERCEEIVRIAEDANRAASDAQTRPVGNLRITADPVFGEAFLGALVIEYARRHPELRVEVALTRRRVDRLEEGFDVAFRVGQVDEPALAGFALGPARVRYCASAEYVRRRGAPSSPDHLAAHDCIAIASTGTPVRWPFRARKGMTLVPIAPRVGLLAHHGDGVQRRR
ncbi:MAG TPA: LysR substrate-binding domain-containing protein [Nannocystaceae bacterium]|nr:LysR substrate-binding domain-containing protein [Nannocystaceae bacterium]